MQIIARIQYRSAIIGKTGMVVQALRQKLPSIAKAETGVTRKLRAKAFIQLRHDRTLHRVDDMRAFEHMVGCIANNLRGLYLVIMVEQACLVPACPARRKVAVVRPFAAQHGAIGGKEIRRRHRRSQEDIVIEIEEMFGKTRNAPQHRFDGQRVERRQRIRMASKDVFMVNDADLRGKFGRDAFKDGCLVIGDNPDPPHPRCIVGDGAHAIVEFVTAHPAMGVGAIVMERLRSLRLRPRQIKVAFRPMPWVRPVHPSNDCIDFKHNDRFANVAERGFRSVQRFWEMESGDGMLRRKNLNLALAKLTLAAAIASNQILAEVFHFVKNGAAVWDVTGAMPYPIDVEEFNIGFSNPKFDKVKRYLARFGYINLRRDINRMLKEDALVMLGNLDQIVDMRNEIAHGEASATVFCRTVDTGFGDWCKNNICTIR